jgi:cytochrome c-type biogenesis protein CcmF
VLLGAREPLALAYVGLCAFAAGTNLLMIIRTLRSGWLRIGGYLAHVGLVVFMVGAVASTWYATSEERILIPEGETISLYGYDFTFNGWRMTAEGRGMLDISVSQNGGAEHRMLPQLYFNDRMGATMATPAVKSDLWQDLYISPQEYQPPFDRNLADIGIGQTKSIGPYTFTFIGFEVPESHEVGSADVGAQLKVEYDGQVTELTPKITLLANEADPTQAIRDNPVVLPGGLSASLAAFDPLQRRVIIRVDGLNFPVDPARAVVVVSTKPGVALVWLGVILNVIGGFIAVVRRTLEGRPVPAGERQRLPRGLGALARFVGNR